MTNLIHVILLGVVEGLTEFLPVSSTGHLLLCERWMGIDLDSDPFWKMFTIFIQIGAIAAVVVYFRQRIVDLLRKSRRPTSAAVVETEAAGIGPGDAPVAVEERTRLSPLMAVVWGTVPVLIAGYATHKWVEAHWEKPFPIAMALGIGGIIMLAIEFFRPEPTTCHMEQMTLKQTLVVGFCQILAAVFPGTSRSAATILPGMAVGMNRESAAEFSFFLAIPAMTAACGYSLLKFIMHSPGLNGQQTLFLVVGTGVSFLVAWAVIAAFMAYIRRHSFVPFSIYRILLCLIVLYYL
jgi:undecaprenyl-diphosphatase